MFGGKFDCACAHIICKIKKVTYICTTNLHFIVPGIQVKVVNSYAAASLLVPVNVVNNVLFPTDGNPTNPIRVSPLLVTSNPRPASLDPALLPPGPLTSSERNFANFALSVPR